MKIIDDRMESAVRSYSRCFPTVFGRAAGSRLQDHEGREYIDFFAGAGALNYGHNDPVLKNRLLHYIADGGVSHSADMATEARCRFLDALDRLILKPRDLDYRVMFPGPTGGNAVEAAVELARKVTGRTEVIGFTNGFHGRPHGMTPGPVAGTGNPETREGAGLSPGDTVSMPFDGYLGPDVDTIEIIARRLDDRSSGVAAPAAFIVETVQAEGGVNVASWSWLERLRDLARDHGALLIVDDIQVGCGRTGTFFSFEPAGIKPDIVCLSRSLSGYGLPLAITLIAPHLDPWQPGEPNDLSRGNNHAFVTATAALEHYWSECPVTRTTAAKATLIRYRLDGIVRRWEAEYRGRGLIQGLVFSDPTMAGRVSKLAFDRGLIIETAGPEDEVLELLPPLTIDCDIMERGLDIIEASVEAAFDQAAGPLASGTLTPLPRPT